MFRSLQTGAVYNDKQANGMCLKLYQILKF